MERLRVGYKSNSIHAEGTINPTKAEGKIGYYERDGRRIKWMQESSVINASHAQPRGVVVQAWKAPMFVAGGFC